MIGWLTGWIGWLVVHQMNTIYWLQFIKAHVISLGDEDEEQHLMKCCRTHTFNPTTQTHSLIQHIHHHHRITSSSWWWFRVLSTWRELLNYAGFKIPNSYRIRFEILHCAENSTYWTDWLYDTRKLVVVVLNQNQNDYTKCHWPSSSRSEFVNQIKKFAQKIIWTDITSRVPLFSFFFRGLEILNDKFLW